MARRRSVWGRVVVVAAALVIVVACLGVAQGVQVEEEEEENRQSPPPCVTYHQASPTGWTLRCEVVKRTAGAATRGWRPLALLPPHLRRAYLALFNSVRLRVPPDGELKRASFHPWAGKRSAPPTKGTAQPFFRTQLETNVKLDPLYYNLALTSKTLQAMAQDARNQQFDTDPPFIDLSGKGNYNSDISVSTMRQSDMPNMNFDVQSYEPRSVYDSQALKELDYPVSSDGIDETDISNEFLALIDALHSGKNKILRKREASLTKVPVHPLENEDVKAQEDALTDFGLHIHNLIEDAKTHTDSRAKGMQKRDFSAWDGKRDSDSVNTDNEEEYAIMKKKRHDSITANIPQRLAALQALTSTNYGNIKRQVFSAWAGKRSDADDKRHAVSAWAGKANNFDDKRQAFSAWAGKRGDFDDKRQAFSAWAGKRSEKDDRRQGFSAWAGKRSEKDDKRKGFSAWAGKRNEKDEKRHGFSAWAGKRSEKDDKREGFSAWAGKRSESADKSQGFSAWAGKRSGSADKSQGFSAWAGKRSESDDKRKGFSAWAGKRSESDEKRQGFSAWAGKRSESDEKRQGFSAWAGKRSNTDDKRHTFSAWAGKRDDDYKREAFSAWAGKRSDSDDDKRQALRAWEGETEDNDDKRQSFSAWAGKRSNMALISDLEAKEPQQPPRILGESGNEDMRKPFTVWTGNHYTNTEDRKASIQKRSFGAWKGKRSPRDVHNKSISRQISDIIQTSQNRYSGLRRRIPFDTVLEKRLPMNT